MPLRVLIGTGMCMKIKNLIHYFCCKMLDFLVPFDVLHVFGISGHDVPYVKA
jgi:hypothetical protein